MTGVAPAPVSTVAAAARPGRLTRSTTAAYGLGDFAGQLVWTLASSYLVLFYTDNVGLAAGTVAVLMLVARLADILIDPTIGALSERHHTRHGRFRPWILYGAPVLALSLVLTFSTVPGDAAVKTIWAAGTYLLLGAAYSAVNLPYGALSAVMTRDPRERVSLNASRMIGANLGAVVLSACTMPLVLRFSGTDGRTTVAGYTLTAAIMAVAAVPLLWIVVARCHEVIRPERVTSAVPLRAAVSAVVGNRPLMLVGATILLVLTGMFGRMAVAAYYYIYVMHRYDLVAWLMMLPSIAAVVGIVAFARVAHRVGKKRAVMLSMLATALPAVALFFADPANVPLVLALITLYGLGNFAAPILMSMVPDAIDYAEDLDGRRNEGSAYAAVSLVSKLAGAVGSAGGAALLGLSGYVANASVQAADTVAGINATVNLAPAALCLLAIVPIAFHPLDEQRLAAIRARLEAGRAHGAATPG